MIPKSLWTHRRRVVVDQTPCIHFRPQIPVKYLQYQVSRVPYGMAQSLIQYFVLRFLSITYDL